MFKVTTEDLKRRKSSELSSLFNQIGLGLAAHAAPSRERAAALASLAMIRAEQNARRGLDP